MKPLDGGGSLQEGWRHIFESCRRPLAWPSQTCNSVQFAPLATIANDGVNATQP